MQKPIKPKTPKKNDSPPSEIITVVKFLVFNTVSQKYELIDHISHPHIFKFETQDDNGNTVQVINDELCPNWDELHDAGYDYIQDRLSYSQYKRIYSDCSIPADDFEVRHNHSDDGYYESSFVKYKIKDPDYQYKLDVYNNRFVWYDKQLADYEIALKKYNDFKLQEKKRKLQEEINKL